MLWTTQHWPPMKKFGCVGPSTRLRCQNRHTLCKHGIECGPRSEASMPSAMVQAGEFGLSIFKTLATTPAIQGIVPVRYRL
jgi:hypothetical protein